VRIEQIEQFLAVVDAGSIRGAASRLGLSQPALSRSLRQLEKDLGVQLLSRTVRGVALTPGGTAFVARARAAGTELRRAIEEARRSVDSGGIVSIGVSPVGAALLLPDLAIELRRLRPQARLRIAELAPSAVLPLVRDAAVDFGVTQRTRAHLDAGLRFQPLFELQMRPCARPGHPLAGARSLEALAGAAWLAMTVPGSTDDIVSRSYVARGLPMPVPVVHCGSYSVALDLVARSDMVTVLPPPVLRRCIAEGRLIEIVLDEPLLPLLVGLYERADAPPTPAARSARQLVVALARQANATLRLRATEPLAMPPVPATVRRARGPSRG
jgi:LysR family transcriptional regulator of abg operon